MRLMVGIIKACETCGEPFKAYGWRIKNGKYCSRPCMPSRKGVRLNTGITHFKKNHGMNKKENNPMFGKKADKHHNWKGGLTITQGGYIWEYCPDHPANNHGYVFQHRLVVEKFIGRYLKTEEVIHHINEIKTDNRIENLMIFPSHKEHAKFHVKMRQYGYLTTPMIEQIKNRWKYENIS